MLTTRLVLWFLLTWLSDAADIAEGGIQAELETYQNNLTALRTISAPPWVSEPSFRGTTSILWSCLATLLACIYTAIHLNVPTETGTVRRLLQKAKWVLTALIAPEIVVYCASTQFLEARSLIKELNVLEAEKKDETEKFHFDMKYGFFALMGGFEVSIAEIDDDIENIRLSPKGILQLAKLGHPLYMSGAKIDDKAKANLIQKSLVILQVTWMATQCVARRAYGLPLTLLEIHTMVHVLCALTMYFFWFYKPLDIAEPQLFDSSAFDDVLALIVQDQLYGEETNHIFIYPPWSPITQDSTPAEIEIPFNVNTTISPELPVQTESNMVVWANPDQMGCILYPSHALKCGFGFVRREAGITHSESPYIQRLSKKGVTRWERASSAITKIEGQTDVKRGAFRPMACCSRYTYFDSALKKQASNLPDSILSIFNPHNMHKGMPLPCLFEDLMHYPLLLALLVLLPAAYGGLHLTAWDLEFPSGIERLIWKIACLDIAITTIVILSMMFVFGVIEKRWYENSMQSISTIAILFMVILRVIYVSCRLFIVVESFISLRKVPIGVYWTPFWLQMIPHI